MKAFKFQVKDGFFIWRLGVLAFGALVLRLVLARYGTLSLDYNTFVAWGMRLREVGYSEFYNEWSDYLPGYLYVLRFLTGFSGLITGEILYKLPAILCDVATGALIYAIVVRAVGERKALWAAGLYLYNPAVIANSTFWGQVDSVTALLSLAAVATAGVSAVVPGILLAVGTLVKPQTAFMLPVVLYVIYERKGPVGDYIKLGAVGLLVFLFGFVPFAGGREPVGFVAERLGVTLGQYPYTSVNAFNFWGIWGFWRSDGGDSLLSLKSAGYLMAAALIGVAWLRSSEKRLVGWVKKYYLSGVIFLITFLFLTRIHERHLLPALAPLVILGCVSRLYLVIYGGLSLSYILNLYYAYVWISNDFTEVFGKVIIVALIFLNLVLLTLLLLGRSPIKLRINFLGDGEETGGLFGKEGVNASGIKKYLLLIVAFAAVTRLFMLWSPPEEYFDEVYHAFTARRMLHNDPKAWEWWNPNPEGFAYEWTHPPFAKEGMVFGMKLWGENAFGWRFPQAVLGVGCVVLIYLIGSKLFNDRLVGIFSAVTFSLDGLGLVMGRIGMNDAYLLFFVLSSLYFFLIKKDFWSALALGFAASAKWSVMWFMPILGVAFLITRRKLSPGLVWFVILVPVVYLVSYIPMFLTGHGFDIFEGVQKQMWWYHTRLDATHPYTSLWWSWPFMVRPIWLYTSGVNFTEGGREMIANIYAMGNPVVFWFGIFSVVVTAYLSLVYKSRKAGFVVFAYFAFFATWAFSPRIMFLYHYLPSVAFMSMASGLVLRRYKNLRIPYFAVALLVFMYFYPHWTGISVPVWLDKSYYWFSSWR